MIPSEKSKITVLQEREFKVAYKKLHPNQKKEVCTAIETIVRNPLAGDEKKGDLKGIFVYKFPCLHTTFLVAYQWDPSTRTLLALGVHENFYRDLKKQV